MKSKHLMTLFALAMLAYQAWRVYDYMGGALTGVEPAVKILVSVAFLAFSEIGLLFWLHVARPNATSDIQETVASIMIWVDFAGSMVVSLGDMLKNNTMYVINLSAIDPLLFIAPWLMVVANLGAYLLHHMNDSGDKLEREERALKHEEASLEVAARRKAIEDLRANKEGIAKELAPHYYKDIRDRVTGRTAKRFKRMSDLEEEQDPGAYTPPAARTNGHKKDETVTYNSEASGNGKGNHRPNG